MIAMLFIVFRRSLLFADISIFLCATLSFVFAMEAEFSFDDNEAILNNPDVNSGTDVINLFKSDFWGTKLSSNSSHKSFRPLAVMLFRFLKTVNQGELNSRIFHSVNVITHGIVCILLHHILRHICKSDEIPMLSSANTHLNISFATTLMFAVHPIHSETICAAVGLADLVSAVFSLVSLLIFLTSNISTLKDTCVSSIILLLLSTVSMLFKEQGITILGICCALESTKLSFKILQRNNYIWLRFLLITFGCSLIIILRCYAMDFKAPTFHEVDNPASFLQSTFFRLVNYNYIYALNFWITIYPLWLCFDWSMGCIPLITSVFDQRLLVVFLFWILFSTFVYKSLFTGHPGIKSLLTSFKYRRLQLCLIFIVITFVPFSNWFFTVGFVIAERSLYFPSIGLCLLILTGCQLIITCIGFNCATQAKAIFYCLIVLLAARSVRRSWDWSTEMQLYKSGLNVCPLNAKVHYNIAKVAADKGDKILAVKEYEEAIKLEAKYYFAMNNLANILKDTNQSTEAERLLRTAVKVKPDFAAAWMNLGIVLSAMKNFAEAEYSYLTALKYRKNYADCLFNLGNLYLEQQRYNEAASVWKNAVLIKPQLNSAWNNLVLLMDTVGDHEKAVEIAKEALQFINGDGTLHFNYANILGKMERFDDAEKHYKIALSFKKDAVYFANLGVLYHLWKRFGDAKSAYENSLSLNPNLQTTKDNLNILLKSL